MASVSEKKTSPPYVSYTSFKSFINGLGESTVPDRIDKTAMSRYSGSTIYALLPALQWLTLIDGDGTPSPLLRNLAAAIDDEGEYAALLEPMIKERYSFLFNGGINLATASSGQVTDAFKAQEIQGSTVTKCISFFLAIAKDARIQISPHVKAPKVARSSTAKKKNNKTDKDKSEISALTGKTPNEERNTELLKITIPLPGMADGAIYLPKDMTDDQAKLAVKMADFILKNYYGIKE